jgi:proteasome lid subunit RPN8/RPN11
MEICRHFEACRPHEGCGLLFGQPSGTDTGEAITFIAGTNMLASATRFRMADAEVLDAFRAMREQDLQLLAIVHSHPRTSTQPSETDLAEMHYPSAAMVIVSFALSTPEASAWLLDAGKPCGYREIVIDVTPG